jgi:chemotaxis protein MotB
MLTRNGRRWVGTVARASALFGLVSGVAACGYSEEEWQAQIDKYNREVAKHQATSAKLAQNERDFAAAKQRVDALEQELQRMGVDLGKLGKERENLSSKVSQLSATLEEREKALAEYRARALQLERIKERFEQLKNKLKALTDVGLAVNIRHNRMIISLPGDVLFASGQDKLTDKGKEILQKVAVVIKGDPGLLSREYQVTGHTDNKPLKGGIFGDNWGLSLMRARQVLLYMIEAKEGGMPIERWSAAGFGEHDPVASNDADDGRTKNRRCEIVVVPSVDEMLSLEKITQ